MAKMSQTQPLVCLYPENISDIQKAIDVGKKASYNRVICRIVSPQLNMRESVKNHVKRDVFTRSELLLTAKQWRQNIVMKVGEFNDCDSKDQFVNKQSNQNMKQEVEWAKHLDELACVMVTLNTNQSTNLARHLMNCFDKSECVLAEIPIVDKTFFKQRYSRAHENIELSTASSDVWHRWNQFRLTADFNTHFKIALELTSTLPSEGDINRWCGEPVELLIIPSNAFKWINNNNQIGLKTQYRDICLQFLNTTGTHFAVRCKQDDSYISSYAHCLRSTLFGSTNPDTNHECNQISWPGLMYSSTPKDTVNNCYKYQQKLFEIFKQAIRLAIADRLQSEEKVRLMICGANGWKLIAPTLSMSECTGTVELFIYEEDSCIQISVHEIIDSLYADRSRLTFITLPLTLFHSLCPLPEVTVIGDATTENYFDQMDIVVSITLQSMYESQWLQFNYDCVKNYIRSDAILIPKHSSLSIVPVTVAKVYSYLQEGHVTSKSRGNSSGVEHYEGRAQTLFPLYTRNLYECAAAQELFSFRYSTKRCVQVLSETRSKKLTFQIERDCTMTGFCGYYQATLYKNITLNNRGWFTQHNKNCVPMVYFPVKSPQTLNAGTDLKTAFWFMGDTDKKKYLYEWQTNDPIITATQNLCGSSCFVQQSMINTQ